MTPKEKALELVNKYERLYIEIGNQYDGYLTMKMHDAKDCALIAVYEILSFLEDDRDGFSWKTYWQEVKQEIGKL